MLMDLPRYLGFPSQIYVTNPIVRDNLFKSFNGKRPIFASTFRFPTRDKPIVDMAIFDIDSKLSLRIPYKDTKKLKDFCDSKDIPYIIDFSGGKGFHFFLITKPEEGSEEVRDKLYSIQLSLVQSLKINAIDLPTIGRLSWPIRVPSFFYVRFNKEKGKSVVIEKNNLYCRFIPPDDFEKGLEHILELAKTPGEIPKRPKATFSMDEIMEKIPKFEMKHKYNGNDNLELMQTASNVSIPSTCAVGLPCLQQIAIQKHPSHYERIELVAWLKIMGYRDMAIVAYIKSLKWSDYNYKDTATNVAAIKPRYPKCTWLRDRYPDLCKNCSLRR
jgi:hypothetical protein